MVKISGPLHSDEAKGSICDFLTFSNRKSGQQCRWQKKQKIVVPSFGQADVQSLYRVIYARWLSFSDAERKVFDDEVKSKNLTMSGWNLFLRKATADPYGQLGLAGYWSFNRKGFGTVLDLSKNGNTGTLMPSWPSDSPQYVDSKNKKMLNALRFDGIDDYVDCGNDSSLDITDAITIEAWVKVNAASGDDILLSKNHQSQIWIKETNNVIGFQLEADSGWVVLDSDASAYSVGQWQHLVFTYDKNGGADNKKIYVDGIEIKATTETGNITVNALSFYLGGHESVGYSFNGFIDGVKIYNRALSASEIKNLFNLFK